jgi:hypothetical protein
VPLETWRRICRVTADLAHSGDPKAREWLDCCLVGDTPLKLVQLAAGERATYSADDDIDRAWRFRESARRLAGSR